jgi:hypothetical protein
MYVTTQGKVPKKLYSGFIYYAVVLQRCGASPCSFEAGMMTAERHDVYCYIIGSHLAAQVSSRMTKNIISSHDTAPFLSSFVTGIVTQSSLFCYVCVQIFTTLF